MVWDGFRLLVSEDGSEFVTIFDAMYGFWIGNGFLADFGEEDENLISALEDEGRRRRGGLRDG